MQPALGPTQETKQAVTRLLLHNFLSCAISLTSVETCSPYTCSTFCFNRELRQQVAFINSLSSGAEDVRTCLFSRPGCTRIKGSLDVPLLRHSILTIPPDSLNNHASADGKPTGRASLGRDWAQNSQCPSSATHKGAVPGTRSPPPEDRHFWGPRGGGLLG